MLFFTTHQAELLTFTLKLQALEPSITLTGASHILPRHGSAIVFKSCMRTRWKLYSAPLQNNITKKEITKLEKRKIIYYTDELDDEFSKAKITPKKIDSSYVYCHESIFKRITHFFWYRIIAMPLAFVYTKRKFSHKVVGREKLKACIDSGYFLYGNHTQDIGDALIPNMMDVGRDKYFIVHPNNVSMPILGKITPSLGAIPLPDDLAAYKNFLAALECRIEEKAGVVVYPEAHIWPYYTKIRPFTDTSFAYPVKLGVPTFCFTNVYLKRKYSREPKIVTYVDGPFYANGELSPREQRRELRDAVYTRMCERAELSDFEKIQYLKKETEND